MVPVVLVTPETLAAIGQSLAKGGGEWQGTGGETETPYPAAVPPEKSNGGKRKPARPKMFGLLLLATGACLVSGLGYSHHCQTHANHKNSEARNFSCQTKAGRRKSVPLLAEGHQKNDQDSPQPVGDHLLPSAEKARPECAVRAEGCVNRQPDGRCRTTEQSCRLLAEGHPPSGLDDIRAMLEKIQAGVVGRAMGPPIEKAEILKPEMRKLLAEGHPAAQQPEPRNKICLAGDVWDVTFDGGRTFHLRRTLGVEYLNYLLHRPGQPISAFDLEIAIRPVKAGARAKDSIQTKLDADAVREYLRQLDRLRAQRADAAEEGDLATADRLDDDITAIEQELTKNGQAPDTGERARDNVRKAIVAVQRKLLKGNAHEQNFSRHLEQFISLGYMCSYHQPPGVGWT